MPFRLRKDTRKWFKDIENAFSSGSAPGFDMYYLCLMVGLAARCKEDVPTSETTELVDQFPGDYRLKGRVIVALFLSRELEAMGITRSERTALHSAIAGLVNPLSASHLSEVGMKEFNKYSFGGFDVLTEWFDDRPRAVETFLPLYKRHMDQAIQKD